jgi:hypothetical protein
MTFGDTHVCGRLARRSLLAPAVAIALMTAAAPAAATCVNGSMGTAQSARTGATAKSHAHAGRHHARRYMEFGRKVG